MRIYAVVDNCVTVMNAELNVTVAAVVLKIDNVPAAGKLRKMVFDALIILSVPSCTVSDVAAPLTCRLMVFCVCAVVLPAAPNVTRYEPTGTFNTLFARLNGPPVLWVNVERGIIASESTEVPSVSLAYPV